MRGAASPSIRRKPDTLALPITACFAQNHGMGKQTGPAAAIRNFMQWAITPPQSYVVYLVCLFLVAGASFYAGTLKPKKPIGLGPPPMSAPRN
jgi:hypothetical protein